MPAVMKSVMSTNVKEIGYDYDKSALIVIWLNSGRISMYSDVPAKLAEDIMKSWSIGTALRDEIKPNFAHRYIRAVDATDGEEEG